MDIFTPMNQGTIHHKRIALSLFIQNRMDLPSAPPIRVILFVNNLSHGEQWLGRRDIFVEPSPADGSITAPLVYWGDYITVFVRWKHHHHVRFSFSATNKPENISVFANFVVTHNGKEILSGVIQDQIGLAPVTQIGNMHQAFNT